MSNMWTVFVKEITDSFRDRRTLIFSILIPAMIFPLLMTFLSKTTSNVEKEVTENIPIAYIGGDSQLKTYLESLPNITIIPSQSPEDDLDKSKIMAIIEVKDDFDQAIAAGNKGDITIKYDESKAKSSMAVSIINKYIDEFSAQIARQRLEAKGIDPNLIEPFNVSSVNVAKTGGMGAIMMSFMLPLFLLIYPAAGAMATAIDQGAGEKERGTLEPLLATQVNRSALAMGKWLSVSLASVMGTVAFMAGFAVAVIYNPEIFGQGFKVSPSVIAGITALGIMMAFIYSAGMLALSVFARNIKEASTYLSPFAIVGMIPAYATMYTDVKTVPLWQYHIPLLNTTLVIKEALLDTINWVHFCITMGWLTGFIIVFLWLVVYMFNNESVVFRS